MVGVPPDGGGTKGQHLKELHDAAAKGDVEGVTKLLRGGAPVDAKDENGYTALQKASCEGHTDLVKHLLKSNSKVDHQDALHGNTALHEAAWKGYSQTSELLLKSKANVYIKNKGGFAPLHLACQNGHNQSCRVLLLAACNPDIKNNYGDTPLHTSARYGHAGVTRILLSARASVREVNKNGDTSLHIAAAMGRRKLTRILLESGADQAIKNKQGETPTEIAQRKNFTQIMEILRNPPPIVTPEERLRQEQEQKQREAKGSKDKKSGKKREKTNDSGTSSKESGSRPKEKKKLRGDPAKVDPHTKTARLTSWGVEWSPYGCPYNSNIPDAHASPKLDTLPSKPLETGEQYFVDLAGNIKKGPVGVGSACYCAPLFKTVQHRMEKDKIDLMDHIDAAHTKLGKRISSLESHTKNHIQKLGDTVQQKLAAEREECRHRNERLKIHREEDVNKKVEELQNWVEKRLTYHHPDSPPTFRGRTFATRKPSTVRTRDPVTGLLTLTRSQSEEAVSEICRDDEDSEPVYKGLRVLDHPTSMYNIPQSLKLEGDPFLYDFPKPCSIISSSADQSYSADGHMKYSEVEMCVPASLSENDSSHNSQLHSKINHNAQPQPTTRQRSSSEDARTNPRLLENLPMISESRRRDPLPLNMSSNTEFFTREFSPSPMQCPADSSELNEAVGNLRVYDTENQKFKGGNCIINNDRVGSDISQMDSSPNTQTKVSETTYSRYPLVRNVNPYMENLRQVHQTPETILSPYGKPTLPDKVPCNRVSYLRNPQTYHAAILSAPQDSDAATYMDMDRFRIQAAVRRLCDDYAPEGPVEGIKATRTLLESSTEHDSHNDSGYSTRLCTASQGPSPALSGIHDSQDSMVIHPTRNSYPLTGQMQSISSPPGTGYQGTSYGYQGTPTLSPRYNRTVTERSQDPFDRSPLGVQGDSRFIPPNLTKSPHGYQRTPGFTNGYSGSPGVNHGTPVCLKEPSLV